MLLQSKSDFQLLGRYAIMGGLNGTVYQIDLLSQEPTKVLKLSTMAQIAASGARNQIPPAGILANCEIVCAMDICSSKFVDELTFFTASKVKKQG